MKHQITILLSSLLFHCQGQVIINDVNINELPEVEYIEMVATSKLFSVSKVTIQIDYGQPFKFSDDQRITGPDGKPIVFDSYIAAMNFVARNGWEYHDAFAVTHSSANVYHFIFRRKSTQQESKEE